MADTAGSAVAAGMSGDDVRVLLADDEPLFRATVRRLLDASPGITVVAEAGTGDEAVGLAGEHRPDLVLMDVRMPGGDGISATARLTARPCPPRVLVLTTFDLDDHVYRALRAGASGFLLKDTTPARLLDAIRIVAGGEALLAPSVTRRLIAAFAGPRSDARPFPDAAPRSLTDRGSRAHSGAALDVLGEVTPREREVLVLITRGLSNAEIQEALHISRATLKTHVGRLLTKLGARDRAQLVIAGFQAGLAGDTMS